MSVYERENRNVLRRCLKTASDGAAVTWAGRSFHTAVPEAVNVQLPWLRWWQAVLCNLFSESMLITHGGP